MMDKMSVTAIAAILMLSGCELRSAEKEGDANAAGDAEVGATAKPVNATAAQATTGSANLSAYVGKYPGDKVAGKRFLDNPLVKAAILAALPDAEKRDYIYDTRGLEVPIFEKGGRVVAWGADRYAEDLHNWAVAISPDGRTAEVCIFVAMDNNPNAEHKASQWFAAGKESYWTDGTCPANTEFYPPKEAGPL